MRTAFAAESPQFVVTSFAQSADQTVIPCHTQDPELWFAQDPTVIESAKAQCAACPVRAACLTGALEREEPWGVWGGQLFTAGKIVAKKRGRGRPRKNQETAA